MSIGTTGAGVLVLAAAGQWLGDGWAAAIPAGMAAGWLLAVLLAQRPSALPAAAYAAVALVAGAGGAVLAGAAPVAAWIGASGIVAGALIAAALLRWKRIDATGLEQLPAFARSIAVAIAVLPLCQLLAALAGNTNAPWNVWLGAALGVLAMLPMVLAASVIASLAGQRTRTERALAAAQDHVHAVTNRSPGLVAILDTDGRHRFANRSYLQWLGRDESQVLGQSLLEVYDQAGAINAPFRRAVAGQPQRQLIEFGDGRVIDAQFEPRFSPEGPVDGVHLLGQDATWRNAQERTIDALLAGAVDATLVLDAAGLIVRLNPKCATLLGAPVAALRGRPLAAWLEPAAAALVAVALARVCGAREPQRLPRSLELHVRHANGGAVPVEIELAPLDGTHGVQAMVVLQDLAPRIAWETLMISTRSQAEITLNAIGDAVVACDLQQRVTAFNPAAVQLTGWPEHEAMGKPLAEVLRFVDAETGAGISSLLDDAIRRDVVIRKHPDKLLLRRDGQSAAVAESAAPMRDQFGLTNGGVVLLHDVSHAHAQTQTLTHQAQHDHLTGLPNRVLLHDRLSQALAQMDRGYNGALLYLDLDHFKPINDRLGHPVGDRVLQEVATRLRACVREDDTVSRHGGDEFVLLLVRLADPRDAARVAGKLIEAIEQPIHVDGHDLSISASIGIALFPQDGRDTGTVAKHADAALYHAKAGGRGRYSYFTDIMSASAEERMRTEHDLRIALGNGDFLLAWQPQVQLPDRRIAGVEALLRWRQRDGSIALPEDFLQVAEETGLLVQIDQWVLHEACRQNRRWQLEWQERAVAPVPVSVNVSLARFDAERLIAHVRGVLHDTGLAPRWLEIEFRGDQLFAHGTRGHALVAALKDMGVRVAVDDFGSGQSSLGALAEFAFDTLKIDRGFIHRIDQDAQARCVTKAVLGIGQAMGIRVVAKGVETDAQLDVLVQLGCTGMQGRMFGDGGPAGQITELAALGAVDAEVAIDVAI